MSTNATVSLKTKKGIQSIYCHWDGYPEYLGNILMGNYCNEEKIQNLLNQGDASIIDEKIDFDPKYEHSFEKRQEGSCLFYHRDRGETLETHFFKTISEMLKSFGQQHNYYYHDGIWYHCEPLESSKNQWLPLAVVLDREMEEEDG